MKQFRVLTTGQDGPRTITADEWRQEMNGFLTFYSGPAATFAIRNDFVVSVEAIQPAEVPAIAKEA